MHISIPLIVSQCRPWLPVHLLLGFLGGLFGELPSNQVAYGLCDDHSPFADFYTGELSGFDHPFDGIAALEIQLPLRSGY